MTLVLLLATIIALILSVAPPPTSAAAAAARYHVLVGVDGLGGEYLQQAVTPTMDQLSSQGSQVLNMQDVITTSSSQNWMSMIAGSSPDQHGVYENDWEVGDSLPTETIFSLLRRHRPNATIAAFHQWTDFARLVEPGVVDVMESPGDEDETMAAAVAFVASTAHPAPDFLFVHLDNVDHAGHTLTWGSTPYLNAINKADRLIGDLVAALDARGVLNDTAFFISADHGGNFFTHGPDTQVCRYIPFIASGSGIRRQAALTREVRIFDVAATLAASMGLTRPASWIARPVYEFLEPFSPLPAPAQKLVVRMVTEYEWIYDTSGLRGAPSHFVPSFSNTLFLSPR